jgi:hypothetical protein
MTRSRSRIKVQPPSCSKQSRAQSFSSPPSNPDDRYLMSTRDQTEAYRRHRSARNHLLYEMTMQEMLSRAATTDIQRGQAYRNAAVKTATPCTRAPRQERNAVIDRLCTLPASCHTRCPCKRCKCSATVMTPPSIKYGGTLTRPTPESR